VVNVIVEKSEVHEFWDQAACGEDLYLDSNDRHGFAKQSFTRYALEPYIYEFAEFEKSKNQKILEIGVGLGADHQKFVEAGAIAFGIDITARAIEFSKSRMKCFGLKSSLSIGDAENLQFDDASFDIIYSWGVIHHSPDTKRAIDEIYRVLKTDGVAKIMIYHKWSMVGLMLWLRYGLLRLKPIERLDVIYSKYLESPGTKAYSVSDARKLFDSFNEVEISTVLTHGDLLQSGAGQRHPGKLLNLARKIWPRKLIRLIFPWAGLYMLIKAVK